MKEKKTSVKIVSQSFYPDIVATGELLYELATKLVNDYNVDVSILTAQPSFVKTEKLDRKESDKGLNIRRITIPHFDKNKITGKIFNSWAFYIKAFSHLLFSKKVDWLLIPTSPPLLPLAAAHLNIFKKQKYIYLLHDIYPEIAGKLGYIKQGGLIYKLWDLLSKVSLRKADKIIVLSDDMKEKLLSWVKNIDEEKFSVIHNWANEEIIKVIPKEENHFLDKFNLRDKFIIEYSGNMGRIHEFSTIMQTAKKLHDHKDIIFLFIGEGGKKPLVESYIKEYNLKNVVLLPYQNREELAYSLGMGDIHIISLQEGYKQLAAPSKLYGILASGKPIAFIGEPDCYISKLVKENECGYHINIDDSDTFANTILEFKNNYEMAKLYGENSRKLFENNFTLGKISKLYNNLFTNISE